MFILPIILLIFLFYCWFNRKYEWALIIITFFLTEGYGFMPSSIFVIKSYDYVILFILIISIINYIENKAYFKVKQNKIVYLIYILLAYQLFEIIQTFCTNAESFGNIIKVARINIIFLAFFIFRKIPILAFKKYFKLNLYFCIIQGLFFYLQPLGINILQGRVDEATSAGEITRFANYPEFTIFYIFYCFFGKKNMYSKIFYTCFWGGMIILGQSRGDIIATSFAFVLYFLMKNQLKYYLVLVTSAILVFIAVTPMFQYRENENIRSSFYEDVVNIISTENITEIKNDSGNFTFRIAMLIERLNYLKDNPQHLLTGVGCIHEDSPFCYERFDFIIGTVNKDRYNGYCLIESGDITWVPILLRYGIIGVIIYSLFLIYWNTLGLKYLKRSHNPIYIATSLIAITTSILTINTVLFDSFIRTYNLLLYIIFLIKYEKRTQTIITIRKILCTNSGTKNHKLITNHG